MRTKLITALRTAAKALDDGLFPYNWNRHAQCNCGVLFCALTNSSPESLDNRVPKTYDGSSWSKLTGLHCPIAGVPTNELFKEILSHGLLPGDIRDLEFLRNREVRERAGLKPIGGIRGLWRKWRGQYRYSYDEAGNVAKYMRAWADIIEENDREDHVAPVSEQVTA